MTNEPRRPGGLTRREFNRLVREAVASLPGDLRERIVNVAVQVRSRPTAAELRAAGLRPGAILFGLYHGVPLTARGAGYQMVIPDTITIYQEPLERRYRDPERLVEQIRRTVLHELAHYFGIDDRRLTELGAH